MPDWSGREEVPAITASGTGWTDELRDRCRNHCAFYGDPPCFELHKLTRDCPEPLTPCRECTDNTWPSLNGPDWMP